MERIISDEERIKRAIEISQRRKLDYDLNKVTRVNVNSKKDYKLFKKMILQIVICLLIYTIFYLINTTNYAFSEQVIKSTNIILNYDINFENLYTTCKQFINTNINNIFKEESNTNALIKENEETMENSNIKDENALTNQLSQIETNTIISNNIDNANSALSSVSKTQMKIDAETAKKICKFKKPLSGTITSEFGEREVTLKGMTADHKGIDIAAKSGTNIKAAISGTVSVAEENSEYGKFIKIVNGDIMTVYAHCKSLKVKKGDEVKIGDKIATVGSTGNSTGPHLHFEIRLSGRYINPRLLINF